MFLQVQSFKTEIRICSMISTLDNSLIMGLERLVSGLRAEEESGSCGNSSRLGAAGGQIDHFNITECLAKSLVWLDCRVGEWREAVPHPPITW